MGNVLHHKFCFILFRACYCPQEHLHCIILCWRMFLMNLLKKSENIICSGEYGQAELPALARDHICFLWEGVDHCFAVKAIKARVSSDIDNTRNLKKNMVLVLADLRKYDFVTSASSKVTTTFGVLSLKKTQIPKNPPTPEIFCVILRQLVFKLLWPSPRYASASKKLKCAPVTL